jgi:hypothetical protein
MYDIQFNANIREKDEIEFNNEIIKINFLSPIERQIFTHSSNIHSFAGEKIFSISGKENIDHIDLINKIIETLLIYDIDGTLIMTKKDISIENINIYSNDEAMQLYINIPYEIIGKTKEKYMSNPKEVRDNFKLKYFDYRELYYNGYIEMLGFSTFFSKKIFGAGLHFFGGEFFLLPYTHLGLVLYNLDYYHSDDNNNYLLFYSKPTIGFQYSINKDVKIYIDGIIKLGFEFIHKNPLFYYAPGFSINLIYKKMEMKYTWTFNPQFKYVHQISISYTDWFEQFRYKK